jgi:hypothetical protein
MTDDEPTRFFRKPKKHPAEDLHLKVDDASDVLGEAVVENPTVAPIAGEVESLGVITNDSLPQGLSEPSVTIVENTTISPKESPIEEKIKQLAVRKSMGEGWKSVDAQSVIELPPRNGMPVKLSQDGTDDGVIAFWKRTRAFANATKRWVETGAWYDFQTGARVAFEPRYWKERF